MKITPIHAVPGLVDVVWDEDLGAVRLKWHSEWDEGTAVRDAVRAALSFVRNKGVTNWLADLSTSRRGMTPADLDWVSGPEFVDLVRASGLRRFALIPPLPETGQDTGWLVDWESNTLARFGDGVQARLSSDMTEIRVFFGS